MRTLNRSPAIEPVLRAIPISEAIPVNESTGEHSGFSDSNSDSGACSIPRAIPVELTPIEGILPHLSPLVREDCSNGIDDDGNGLVDCADRESCPDGSRGPDRDILATQCCDGRAMNPLEMTSIRHCGGCRKACVYPQKIGSSSFLLIGSCEKDQTNRSRCVPPASLNVAEEPVDESTLKQEQLENAVCFEKPVQTLEKALERLEELEPNVSLAGGRLSLSVDGKCVGFSFKKKF